MINSAKAFSSFSVNDIEKARDFYQNILGLDVNKVPMGESGLLEIQIAGGAKVMVYPKPNHVPATFTVLNFPVDDLEKTVDELISRGVKFEQYDLGPMKTNEKGIVRGEGYGPDIAWFTDPASNIIGVMQSWQQ